MIYSSEVIYHRNNDLSTADLFRRKEVTSKHNNSYYNILPTDFIQTPWQKNKT